MPAITPSMMLNADLHCHSNISDGTLKPAEVAARAKANGVELWALTDHDEVGGIAEARAAAEAANLPYVTGVEISVTWAGKTIHIVGLGVDETDAALLQGLAWTRNGREPRAKEMAQKLDSLGIPSAFEGAMKYAGNPDLLSRTHFARYLIEIGKGETIQDVFKNYLVEGKPGYVPHRWAYLKDAVRWIRDAGGAAIVAHPGRYKLSDLAFDEFVHEFKQSGGTGIEVITGSHSPDQYDTYANVARRYGLLASRGSDFHGPEESRVDIGTLPPLPSDLQPVWHDWKL
ncbi:MAG TPA: 3',5'-nucleoside bisphosphate phosphatase [Burkholderiaceae bacterium]